MSASTRLFLKRKFSPFRYSLLPRCSFFSTSKLSGVKSSNELETQDNEDRRIAVTRFLLNECGLSESQVLPIGRRRKELFKSKSIRRAQQAVQFFRDSGFTEDQIEQRYDGDPIDLDDIDPYSDWTVQEATMHDPLFTEEEILGFEREAMEAGASIGAEGEASTARGLAAISEGEGEGEDDDSDTASEESVPVAPTPSSTSMPTRIGASTPSQAYTRLAGKRKMP